MEKQELSSVLVDVRKAYRLLYLFQRRIMDTVKFMGDLLSKNIQGGWALYSNTSPKNGAKLYLDQSAWDWLNMYLYEFYFQEEVINGNTIHFAIVLQSDSGGWFEEIDKSKRLDLEYYPPVEESKSRFIFFVGVNRWKPDNEIDKKNYYDFIKNGSNSPYIFKTPELENEIFFAQSYLLEDFGNEESIRGKLLELTNICNNYGLGRFSNFK